MQRGTTFDPFKDADGARLCVSQTQFKRTGRDVVTASWDAYCIYCKIIGNIQFCYVVILLLAIINRARQSLVSESFHG
jgi:hypothetical protein